MEFLSEHIFDPEHVPVKEQIWSQSLIRTTETQRDDAGDVFGQKESDALTLTAAAPLN